MYHKRYYLSRGIYRKRVRFIHTLNSLSADSPYIGTNLHSLTRRILPCTFWKPYNAIKAYRSIHGGHTSLVLHSSAILRYSPYHVYHIFPIYQLLFLLFCPDLFHIIIDCNKWRIGVYLPLLRDYWRICRAYDSYEGVFLYAIL